MSEAPKIVDEFAAWVRTQREKRKMSMELLAHKLREKGYPVSVNKLWRIEQGHERVKKVDGELAIWLERVFGESCPVLNSGTVSVAAVQSWMNSLLGASIDLASFRPKDLALRQVWSRVVQVDC